MMNRIGLIALAMIAAVCVSPAQTGSRPVADRGKAVVWSPPNVGWWDEMPKATVPKVMIGSLRVAGLPIVLEKTNLEDAHKHFGGTIGSQGDASESLGWICLDGRDKEGAWILWLFSGEIDGPAIGGFEWRHLSTSEKPDHRCSHLPKNSIGIELPIVLHLGMTEAEVRTLLGSPTAAREMTLFYCHEHQTVIRKEDYTVSNNVAIVFRKGAVWAIEVTKTTSN
jgi:hypothetical protein